MTRAPLPQDRPVADPQQRIQVELVNQLYRQAPAGMIATIVNSAILSFVFWNTASHRAIIIWLACLSLITLVRGASLVRSRRLGKTPADADSRGTSFIIGLALSGIVWGASALFLFPATSTAHQVFLAFVLGGMVAGAAGTYSIVLRAYLAFSLPALVPLCIRFFVMGDEIHIAMGGMILLFSLLFLGVAMRVRDTAVISLRLREENSNLIAYLASAKERAEELNEELLSEITERRKAEEEIRRHREHLEELVKERTAELSSANDRLQQEISARMAAEETLRRSDEYFRSLIENALDIITVLDVSGNIHFESPSIEKILGYRPAELVGENVFAFVHPDDLRATQEIFTKLIMTPGSSESIEVRIRHRNGTWRLLEAIGKSITDSANEVRVIVNSRDNTDRKRLEENVVKSQKLESLGTLAGGIAHDFNNVVTGITANIELAKLHAKHGTELYAILQKAEQASVRARDLTQQLLTFSMGGDPVKKPVLVNHLIKESAEFALRGSRAACDCTIPDDLRPVEADEGQMRQVIHNIVMNADQAMPQGGKITITCENAVIKGHDVPALSPGEYVKIAVADHGIGIPVEHLSKIFDPYFTTKQKGSGLGLATSYSIIKKHGGTIAVESEIGVGTMFTLYLPVSRSEFQSPKAGSMGLVAGKGRVLIMDDEEIIRDSAGRILQTAGYEVELATDGSEAIELYRKAAQAGRPFDVVIMDLTVPGGIGGKDALQRLIEIDPAVKAIVSSGYSHDPIMANYRDYGFKGVIAKPYKIRDMSEIVRNVLMGITSNN
jgi:PAS domain S-box-containing protein